MILVLNCGSQSIKWKLFDNKLSRVKQNELEVLNSGDYEKVLTKEIEKLKIKNELYGEQAIKIELIGHRVVHGGEKFSKPLKITDENLKQLESVSRLAPLHNPHNILGIKVCREIFKDADNFAVFDTEFFDNLPEVVRIYALPEDISKKFGFRKYGFHGISHEYVAKKGAEIIKKPLKNLKVITCHLGGGASITAIKNGKAIDTSMGFTPMEGLVMMTRAGSIDPGIILKLAKEYGPEKTDEILNKESGIRGVCGYGDMLSVLGKIKEGDKKAKLAFDVFVYSVKKYIGAYFAVLGGCDLLIFTGAVGAGKPITRNAVCRNLNILRNAKVLAIKTDEELAIAQKIWRTKEVSL